jgi:aldehyde:ferredoxin oxidoreductase
VDISDIDTVEKLGILRKLREKEYEKLKDAVYKRRGWTNDGIPTVELSGVLELISLKF